MFKIYWTNFESYGAMQKQPDSLILLIASFGGTRLKYKLCTLLFLHTPSGMNYEFWKVVIVKRWQVLNHFVFSALLIGIKV
jgi:hypothetical protein